MTRKVEPYQGKNIAGKEGTIAERFARWLELLRAAVNSLRTDVDLINSGGVAINIFETGIGVNYTALPADDIVYCLGNLTVTLPLVAEAYKEIYVQSAFGTVTLAIDGGEVGVSIEAPTSLATGARTALYFVNGIWYHKFP